MTIRAPMHWTSKSSKSFTKLKNKLKGFLSSSFKKRLSLQLNGGENSIWLLFMVILWRISICVSIHTIKMMRQPENPSLRELQIVHLALPKPCDLVQEKPKWRCICRVLLLTQNALAWTVPNAILNHKKARLKPNTNTGRVECKQIMSQEQLRNCTEERKAKPNTSNQSYL